MSDTAGEGASRCSIRTIDERPGVTSKTASFTTRSKSAYAPIRIVKGDKVHITTQSGVVKLGGVVNSPAEAEDAIRKAPPDAGRPSRSSSEADLPARAQTRRRYLASPAEPFACASSRGELAGQIERTTIEGPFSGSSNRTPAPGRNPPHRLRNARAG